MVPGDVENVSDDEARRLRAEAEAQNARVLRQGPEPRDKFYYLLAQAFRRYDNAVGRVDGLRVLVAGCSQSGVIAMARNGAIVTGIDIADEAVKRLNDEIEASGLSDRASAQVMNAEQVEFAPGTFDLIVCTGVLHHLDVQRAAGSWARALKATGRVVMLEPMAWNPAAAVYRLVTPSMRTADEHPLRPHDLRLLREAFSQVTMESYVLTSALSVVWAIVPDVFSLKIRWRDVLDKADRALMNWFPNLGYLGWSAVIECSKPVTRHDL